MSRDQNLFPALNSLVGDSLGKKNFHILCTALFLPEDAVLYKDRFAGICALTERLFWSSYIETSENTFYLLGQNRSLLECADFSGLQWKLHGLEISFELRTLLFSLA
ncbi:serine/arginine repetitive matrix protein 1-like [Plakobranchus ocellatus]|uniref:Serine/arginine repetitive matrix protein 1-like n=1 Tax=Plakobranchus ocellatus TaxID=259542 RepID=A0AAV4ARN8_9GAST|nr:serine/arginine repetitive matrix protein 1-like [Plakobranchus ocellatus]